MISSKQKHGRNISYLHCSRKVKVNMSILCGRLQQSSQVSYELWFILVCARVSVLTIWYSASVLCSAVFVTQLTLIAMRVLLPHNTKTFLFWSGLHCDWSSSGSYHCQSEAMSYHVATFQSAGGWQRFFSQGSDGPQPLHIGLHKASSSLARAFKCF